MDAHDFIRRWANASIGERAHCHTFIQQLCDLIGAPAPDQEIAGDLDYCFERPVWFLHDDGGRHSRFIDCYKRDCFVLEAKQSRKRRDGGELDPRLQMELFASAGRKPARLSAEAWERLMRSAKRQAEGYAKALDEWPPFLVIVDVGRAIELWSDFPRQGKAYAPFPDRARYRIELEQLADPAVRERLRRVWTDPMSLDPAQHVAEVTTDIAGRLARLVRSIGSRGCDGPHGRPDAVARAARANQTALFVMQCIFAMFADSVGLIEKRGFLTFLEGYRGQADQFHKGAGDFFRRMDEGGHCSAIRQDLKRFNGGLFKHVAALPITEAELEALIAAARRDWASVEPAIFGALLEQALDSRERSELGAHYTPRAYVERLVEPTLMEPLRADWEALEARAIAQYLAGDDKAARRTVREFHRQLCAVRVLDPACGTGNFLYVAMGMMKALEGEVLGVLAEMGERQAALELDGHTVSPEQFWGIEKNAYAAWIAEMVMWIGYLQWHFRLFGDAKPSEPILRNFEKIQRRDALLAWSGVEMERDGRGRPRTWRRAARKADEGPRLFEAEDEDVEVVRYLDPRPASWPDVHFIIGNPPFIGGKNLRRELGPGYVDALWHVRQGRFRSADLVTAWWDRAAEMLTRPGSSLRRFGFITTNSITQTFSRRVLEHHLDGQPPMRLVFAIPDHPWLKGGDRAAVRIAMTVAERGEPDGQGRLLTVVSEVQLNTDDPTIVLREQRGVIGADLTIGGEGAAVNQLKANDQLSHRGVQLSGAGFLVTETRAAKLLEASEAIALSPVRSYRNGRDLADQSRRLNVIDLLGWDENDVRRRHPGVYQHLLETVKPERERNNRRSVRENWWLFGEPRREMRPALEGLRRYIATVETAKHRWFRFLDGEVLPDNKLVVVASDDARLLGVLSSRLHRAWFVANAGRIGVYEKDAVYVKSACFDAFPFPDLDGKPGHELGELAEELDARRDQVLADHPDLTMTGLYNARDRLASGEALTDAERSVVDRGLVRLLDHLHRRIDEQTAQAYGWPTDMNDEAAVTALAQLNRERAQEESRGVIRFLRPGYQAARVKVDARPVQIEASLAAPESRPALPETPEGLASALLVELRRTGAPVGAEALAERFEGRTRKARVREMLAVLTVAGSVHRTEAGWFAAGRRG
jgi:hypothetical protein